MTNMEWHIVRVNIFYFILWTIFQKYIYVTDGGGGLAKELEKNIFYKSFSFFLLFFVNFYYYFYFFFLSLKESGVT